MKKTIFYLCISFLSLKGISQEIGKDISKEFLTVVSDESCKCIDSISTLNKGPKKISSEMNSCINKQVISYQLMAKLMQIDTTSNSDSNIVINENEKSEEFKKYYYEIERYLFNNCKSVKEKMAAFNKENSKSLTKNALAKSFYNTGIDASKAGNMKEAIVNYKEAVKIDPNFVFAWDNLGLSYRQINDYDKAIEAYKNSLKIDPNGFMPLQNLAIAYQYQKKYKKAIRAYNRLAKLDDQNPEIYYGIGRIYTMNLNDLEKGLDNICKAYTLYVSQNSPYRTDAEKIINLIASEMKKEGKETAFNAILKKHNISY